MPTGQKRKISVTVDETYMEQIDAIMEEEERKMSQLIEFAVRDWLEARAKRKKKPKAQPESVQS